MMRHSQRNDEEASGQFGSSGWLVVLAAGLLALGTVGCDSQGGQSDESADQTGQSAGVEESSESADDEDEQAGTESSDDEQEAESTDEGESETGDTGAQDDKKAAADKGGDKQAEKKATPPKVTGKLTGSVSDQGSVKSGTLELMVRNSGEVVGRFTGESDKKFRIPVTGKVTDNKLEASGSKGNSKVNVTGSLSANGADVDVAGSMFGNNFEFGTKLSK
jgi:cytoskeletal protein RodZ